MGKGSHRRPRQVPYQQYAENWDAAFGKTNPQSDAHSDDPPPENSAEWLKSAVKGTCESITLNELAAMMGITPQPLTIGDGPVEKPKPGKVQS